MEWIPVTERLPDDDCRVLCATWLDMTGTQRISIYSFRHGTGQFNYGEEVTHWMPLPEPPTA